MSVRILAYTITRASTQPRARLLLDTLTRGQDQAGLPFDWEVWVNGSPLAADFCESAKNTGIIKGYHTYPHNVGQHIPTNDAIHRALEGGYDYLLRIDDDVEWETKRWLAKLVEASVKALKDTAVVSPKVEGLKYPPPQSDQTEVEGIPIKLCFEAIGGICRLIPMGLFKANPYLADTRQPMGFGDATGIARWATMNTIPMVYVQSVRIRHAKGTARQEREDPEHFNLHPLLQRMPYIPPWKEA